MAAELLKHIVYINLDERTDRKEHFRKEIQKLKMDPLTPVRIPGKKMAVGAMGCSLSHIKALEYAKEQGWPQVLICEDDITFTNPGVLFDSLEKCSRRPGWDVLLLGGNNWPPFYPVSDHCIRVNNCLSATGYIVRQRYYDTLLNNFREGVKMFLYNPTKGYLYALDVYWRKLQIRDKWFMVIPATVNQWDNYSNIENRTTAYSPLMLDYAKSHAWIRPDVRERVMREMKFLGKPLVMR